MMTAAGPLKALSSRSRSFRRRNREEEVKMCIVCLILRCLIHRLRLGRLRLLLCRRIFRRFVYTWRKRVGLRGVQDQRMGIEEQSERFNVGSKQQVNQKEDGFAAISSPPPLHVTISLPAAAATVPNEFQTRVF
ncbi:unnamed protein product [Eruca vesicaria subsp. sativa]|uniref:Uncharacterized protein n=1 Tax=Eruca vesicaria subsp. sativa TaxID=29727 RepID=A0ABC8KGL6_ERUVS|nr:unnamed protein product [Eruca vesicaria subsp. sativa]